MKNTLIVLATLFLISNTLFGQNISSQIDSIIKSSYAKNPTLGISVGFIHNKEEYYTAYGKISKESNIDISRNSIFEIASITKIITSNLIAQAVLEEKVALDDFMDHYLPEAYVLHKNLQKKIKISDLASHQSGLPDLDFKNLIVLDAQQPIHSVNQQTLSTIINNCSELIDYGNYRYSTIGYTLLGQILETIYGKSYDEIIRAKMITPLQMTNTLTKTFAVNHKTTGYNANQGVQEFLKWNITAPAGLVKSSASDMIAFLKVVLDDKSPFSKAAMISEKIFYEKGNRALGLGLNVIKDDKNTIYLKSGDSMGQSSIICYNRAQNWGIVILLNQRNSKIRQQLLNEIYETILK